MSGGERDDAEGWEGLAEEESSGGTLSSNPELEAALREAAEAVDARAAAKAGGAEKPDAGGAAAAAAGEGDPPGGDPVAAAFESDDPAVLRAGLERAHDRFLRLSADFENFRRRSLKERQEAYRYGPENLVKDLLATVDNLERAIDHARKGAGASGGGDLESLLQGVELVQREFLTILENHYVTEIEALGKPFDPALHEAMAQVPDGSVPPNTVIDVLQKGFQLRDRLLRPARVVVAKAPEAGGESAEGKAAD